METTTSSKRMQCVRHEIINKDGKQYMLCRGCGEVKELTSEYWNKNGSSRTGFIYRCKECMKPINKETNRKAYYKDVEKSRNRARLYRESHKDSIRESRRKRLPKENAKRRERMSEISVKIHEHTKEMGYVNIQRRTRYLINKLGIRPKQCPICGYKTDKVVAHHPNYDKQYQIVFCCNSCHKLIHLGELIVKEEYITTLGEEENGVQIIRCEKCGTKIKNIAGTKFCKSCSKIAHKESIERFNNRKKTFISNNAND